MELLTPNTVKKTVKNKPIIRLNLKSGLIAINTSATADLFPKDRSFIFVNIEEDKTTYLMPTSEGFEFRFVEKNNKSHSPHLLHNSIHLVKAIFEFNKVDSESYAFRIQNPQDLEIQGVLQTVYPLIKAGK